MNIALIPSMMTRAKRIAIMIEFINTLPDASERKECIMRLHAGEIISPEAAQLLIEHFELEAA